MITNFTIHTTTKQKPKHIKKPSEILQQLVSCYNIPMNQENTPKNAFKCHKIKCNNKTQPNKARHIYTNL